MDRINEIGDTKKGQEMLGRTAERAYQRAQRTSGADKKRYMRTYNDAYKTGGKSSNKHLGGSREHFDNGRDYEYEKWADEHNGNVAESKNMNKKLIRLTESDLHKIVKESVNRVLNEVWDIDDNGVIDYDEFGRAKNRSYADVRGLGRGLASDTKQHLRSIPNRDFRAITNYQNFIDSPKGREYADDSGKWMRPSDWFVRGADGWDNDEFKDFDKQTSQQPKADKSFNRALDAADKRPLHRKGSLNRAFDD